MDTSTIFKGKPNSNTDTHVSHYGQSSLVTFTEARLKTMINRGRLMYAWILFLQIILIGSAKGPIS
jgi:hypothetical protein